MSDERCQRCGEVDTDRRTLWMACMYEMNETGLPFDQVAIDGHVMRKAGTRHLGTIGIDVPIYERADPDAEKTHYYHFYTLRACKRCRAAWMSALQAWFNSAVPLDDDPEADIPIREKGAVRMVTSEEYERLYPGRQPHRITP